MEVACNGDEDEESVSLCVTRRKKLSDVFRKIHGNTARAYTRESATVRTRLDRNIGYTHKTKIVK